MSFTKLNCWFASAVVLSAIVGCGSKPAAQKPGGPANNQAATTEAEEAGITAILVNLSAEDRALAIKQKVCPVSDARLGTPAMGAPPKVEVKGNTVFICCEMCRQALVDEPDKYLAKLGLTAESANKKQ
ncbi:MAG: hypothetical protein WD669_00195 [Pirellulales bacterium]